MMKTKTLLELKTCVPSSRLSHRDCFDKENGNKKKMKFGIKVHIILERLIALLLN